MERTGIIESFFSSEQSICKWFLSILAMHQTDGSINALFWFHSKSFTKHPLFCDASPSQLLNNIAALFSNTEGQSMAPQEGIEFLQCCRSSYVLKKWKLFFFHSVLQHMCTKNKPLASHHCPSEVSRLQIERNYFSQIIWKQRYDSKQELQKLLVPPVLSNVITISIIVFQNMSTVPSKYLPFIIKTSTPP